ncbi:hypothetical protein ABPG72_018909 [Tetrahymena utriculariae]
MLTKNSMIQNIKLYDQRDLYEIEIQFNEEEYPKESQKSEKFSHYIIQGIDFILDNSKLKIFLSKNRLKEINPYILLQKMIDKINQMYYLYKYQKDQFNNHPIVKGASFNWICIDLELQFFEKPSSQHQIQIQETFKARISNILYTDLLNEISLKIQDESSLYQVQIIKKIADKYQLKHNYEMPEDQFFMNQIYNFNDNIVNQIEQLCLILYIVNFDIVQNRFIIEDYFDLQFFQKRIKYLAQGKSVCLNIIRMLYSQNNYFQEIQTNPFVIYKSMPFSITLIASECFECQQFYQRISDYIKAMQRLNLMNTEPEQIKQKKEEYGKQIAEQKQKVQTHTRVITMQINVMQDIFQNQYQYNENICSYIFAYLKTLQTLFSRYFSQLEGILNPTNSSSLKRFEIQEINLPGSILNRRSHSIYNIKVFYNDYDKLDFFYKNLKYYTCYIQKLLRQVYFMNLIGKDPNDLGSLNENQPYFNFDINDDMKNQQISFEIKRSGLDFIMAIKPKFEDKQKIFYYQLYFKQTTDSNTPQINKEYKDLTYQDTMKLIFKSAQSHEIEAMSMENQIKHMTNYYGFIQQILKNPEEQLYQQMIYCLKTFDKYYIFTDFSKKEVDILNIEGRGFKQPKYLFEVRSIFDESSQRFYAFSIKIYFGRCIENKFFILMEKSPNEIIDVKYIQVSDIQFYLSEFMRRYVTFL